MNSSAKFYTTGEQRIYPATNIQELMDIDLTRIPYNARRVPCGRLGYDMACKCYAVGQETRRRRSTDDRVTVLEMQWI